MANELPEVMPEVRNMPTEGWFMQTSGSARKKVIDNSGSNNRPVYAVSGVPRHTHNASVLISVDADYTQVRTEAADLAAGAWSYDALPLQAGMLTDSVAVANEDERFERVVERCVGYITMAPENCQSFIREPARSVSEIRTLVAPKTRLDTLTYVEELGGLRVPSGDQGASTALVSEFPDVSVSLTRQHKVGSINMRPLIKAGTGFLYEVSGPQPAGHAAVILSHPDEPVWDGTLTYRWDPDARQYFSLPLTVKIHTLDEYVLDANGASVRAQPAEVYTGPTAKYVHFPEHRTSVADSGFCWICTQDAAGVFSMGGLSHAGAALAINIPCIVRGARQAGPYLWGGMPAQRIPVGGTEAFPGPSNFALPPLPAADGRRFWDMMKAYPANMYEYSRRLLAINGVNTPIADAGDALLAGIANNSSPYTANPFDMVNRQISVYGMLPKLKPGGIQTTALAGVTLGNLPSIPRKRAGVLFALGTQGPGAEIVNEPVHFDQPITFTSASATASIINAMAFAASVGVPANTVTALWANAGILENVGYIPSLPTLQDPRTTSNTITFTGIAGNVPNVGLSAATAENDCYIMLPYVTRAYRMVSEAEQQDNLFPAVLEEYYENLFHADAPIVADGAANATTFILARVHDVTNVAGVSWSFSATYEIPEAMRHTRTLGEFDEALDIPAAWNSLNYALGHNAATGAAHADQKYIDQGQYFPWYQNFTPALAVNAFAAAGTGAFTSSQAGSIFSLSNTWHAVDEGGPNNYATIHVPIVMGDPAAKIWARFGPVLGNGDVNGPATPLYRLELARTFLYTSDGADASRWYSAFRVYEQNQATDNEARTPYGIINGYKQGGAQQQHLTINVLTQTQSASMDALSVNVAALRAEGQALGAVHQSKKRISQHVCAPLVNPNMRIGAAAPLNHDSRHLPAEMRDFRLHFDTVDWGRLGVVQSASNPTLNALTLYNFDGGVQKQTENPSLLYLPRFVEHKSSVSGNSFEFECYSDRGSPGFYAIFCRKSSTDLLQQPRILSLTIFNDTTKRKSNVVNECSISELYHLTQRNVHPEAHYDRKAYDRRQTILLSAEDVGMMGFKPHEYQKQKRARYVFSGTLNEPGDVYVIFVFNNRGLHIDGRNIGIVNLHQ
jgi:hypothetical protein